jgi:hypothetical protein
VEYLRLLAPRAFVSLDRPLHHQRVLDRLLVDGLLLESAQPGSLQLSSLLLPELLSFNGFLTFLVWRRSGRRGGGKKQKERSGRATERKLTANSFFLQILNDLQIFQLVQLDLALLRLLEPRVLPRDLLLHFSVLDGLLPLFLYFLLFSYLQLAQTLFALPRHFFLLLLAFQAAFFDLLLNFLEDRM